MKISKKIVVPVLSTVAGLALIGGVSGAVAWYQYNTRVTASFVGTSVANSGLLQISANGTDWGREVNKGVNNNLLPVTFGATESGIALPTNAYAYPEAGEAVYTNWAQATAGVEFVQFSVYLRATKSGDADDKELVAKKVYISEMHLDDANTTDDKDVSEALRVHLAVEGGKNFLISKTGIVEDTTTDPLNPYYGLPLFGKMDLDGDGQLDQTGKWAWDTNREDIIYGDNGTYQTTTGMSDVVAPRNTDGDIVKGSGETDEHFAAKEICTTPDGSDVTKTSVKVTVTVWLEGWHKFENANHEQSSIWESVKRAGTNINVGFQFDVGKNAFRA